MSQQDTTADLNDAHDRSATIFSMIGSALPFSRIDNKLCPTVSASPTTGSYTPQRRKAVDTLGKGSYSLDDHDRSSTGSSHDTRGDTKDPESHKEKSVADAVPGVKFANAKRNSEFHKIFPKISPNEPLIDDFGCALAREILLQGRLYVTPHHVAFHSNILGWTTHLILSFREIIDIQTKSTAGLFPNGITIQTLHARHSFATFANRDATIKFLRTLWQSPLNSHSDSSVSSVSSSRSSSFVEDMMTSDEESAVGLSKRNSTKSRAHSRNVSGGGQSGSNSHGGSDSGNWPVENLGPDTHEPTTIPQPDPKEKIIDTSTINAPVGVVANLIYGDDTKWYGNFIIQVEGNRDLSGLGPFSKEDGGKASRSFEYVKPLSGPVGPRQTRCQLKETREEWDMEDKVVVLSTTRTPDVPSGDAFTVFTRSTLAWAEGNKTTMQNTTWVEWTGKSWIKGPIEKGALEGQIQHCKALAQQIEKTLGKKAGGTTIRKKSRKSRQSKAASPEPVSAPATFGGLDTQQLLVIGAVVLIVGLLVLLWWSYSHKASKSDIKYLEQELKLWRWLDDRTSTNEIDYKDMSERELREVIDLTEKKLSKLREFVRSD